MARKEVGVLVVGAGPAGLTAAAALRRYGADVLVLDRKARLSAHPRATVVSRRSMELLRSWGLEDEIRAGGIPDVEWLGLVTETLASADRGETVTLAGRQVCACVTGSNVSTDTSTEVSFSKPPPT
jgi:2-polyprenyl-6-methoxyphenol hydroxylase-like FAD-dependent oxidoreductase